MSANHVHLESMPGGAVFGTNLAVDAMIGDMFGLDMVEDTLFAARSVGTVEALPSTPALGGHQAKNHFIQI